MNVGVVIFEGADVLDVIGPLRVFGAVDDLARFAGTENVHVELVAADAERVPLSHGVVVEPTTTFETCPPLDVIVIPGGSSHTGEIGRRRAQRDPAVLGFVRERAGAARATASVCTGAFIAAEAGLLAGRRANTHWQWRTELIELMRARGEDFELVPDRVVWDGDYVSGGGVTSGMDIALSVVERVFGAKVRSEVESVLERETPPG